MIQFAQKKHIKEKNSLAKWKILIADDEVEVHTITESVLSKFSFANKEIEFLHAYSGEEAINIIGQNQDIALVLLDVVMESDDAGLKTAKAIREELNNKSVRIILRTGQPGEAPEKDIIKDYDINDYREKTELTSTKLYSTVIAALRSYRDIITIEQSRDGLTKIIDATKSLFTQKSLVLFAEGVLTQLLSIIMHNNKNNISAYFATLDKGEFYILSSVKKNTIIEEDATYLMYEAFESKKSFFKEDVYIGFYESANEKTILLYLEGCSYLNEIDRNLLEIFSNNISIAFDNLCLNNEMVNTQSEIVKRLGEVIESRSKETANHVSRVANISYILAKAYGLSEEEATKIKLASPMHDIGKVAIPDEILLKPGKLTFEEFEKMKEHSQIGWEILKDSKREILRTAALIARDHHEKWDGSGYPSKSKGEDISVCGRITAVADVFDALSHKRVYKDAWPLEKILNLFKEERGKHFEPKLVDLLFENLDQIIGKDKEVIKVEVGGNQYIKNIKLSAKQIEDTTLEKLLFPENKTKLVIGYISPHVDFATYAKKIKNYFSDDIKVLLSSSAGELCNIIPEQNSNIYLDATNSWDSVVLQSFSNDIIKDVTIFTVDLQNEDIVQKNITKTTSQRVELLTQEIKKLQLNQNIDYKKHFAFTLIDGVSNSESFFMEAIYRSGKFPCNIIGGSAGGTFDFKDTYLFDNQKVVQQNGVIALVEVEDDMRFGILKTQNFAKTKHSFTVVDANVALRCVKTVKRKNSDKTENIIDYFCSIFKCEEKNLEKKFNRFAFGLEIEDELYIRSVASVDLKERIVYFYIDVDFGDELSLCRMTDIKKQTQNDFDEFLKDKPSKPVAGLLNDCILRRVFNANELTDLKTFDEIPLIGFSTFGEFMGININQTLTALFFFEVEKDQQFGDKYIDNFIIQYSNYQNFFRQRELKQLKSKELKENYTALNSLNHELKEKINEIEKSRKKLVEAEKMATLGSMVAGIAHEINTPVGMALTGTTHLLDETKTLKKLFEDAKLSEEDFKSYLQNSTTLNHSIQNNLTKAADLVKSFKQVAVDQSSNEDREFNLKEYIDEILLSIHNQIKKTKHKIIVDIDSQIKLKSNPGAFSQIFTNFIMNSIIHGFENIEKGEIKISAFVEETKLHIMYEDNGVGLSSEQKEKIFDPFFTTKRGSGGSGLGMHIVYNLITTKLGGEIEVESKKGEGIKFIMQFESIVQ